MNIRNITRRLSPAAIAVAAGMLGACSDTTGSIGSSLVEDETEVVVETYFKVTGHTSASNIPVQSRTISQLLGSIHADGYGSFSSEFVTQFLPATSLDTEGVLPEYIDSMKLTMQIPLGSGCIGDSILPMGLNVYRLNRQLPQPIYSDFDASEYYDARTGLLASKIYSYNTIAAPDSIKKLNYRVIDVDMPVSLARELFNLYKENPAAYATPMAFARYFPGIAVTNSFGSGRVVDILSTTMRMYYHTMGTDEDGNPVKVPHSNTYFAVTPEIVSNNCITYDMASSLQQRIDAGENIIVAPAGRDVEMEFPIKEVVDYYYANSGTVSAINTLTFQIPASVVENSYGIEPPAQLLLVLKDKKNEFFLNNSVTNNVNSFYAEYNAAKGCYTFSALRPYLMDIIDRFGAKGVIPAEEYTFSIVPVTVETETISSYGSNRVVVSSVTPYVQKPAMVRLDLDKATVKLTFSKQTMK